MSFINTIPKLPVKVYNAIFTPMGRKSLRNRIKTRQAERNADYRKNGTMVYPLKSQLPFVLHRGNQLSELIYLEGAYEPLETLIVSQLVQSGDVVFDLGANVGYFTSLLDRLVKPGGQVHSFEPGQGTFAMLGETKKLLNLSQTTLYQQAISDQVGEIDFWLSTTGSDAQQSTMKNAALGQETRRHTVASMTLDAFVAKLKDIGGKPVAFVKCDIEGAELSMIKGAGSVLNSQDPPFWLVEHNREALQTHGASSRDLVLPFANFDVYFVPISWPPSIMATRQAIKLSGDPAKLPDECNLIILPKSGQYAKRTAKLKSAGLIP